MLLKAIDDTIVIILTPRNLERMKQGDPATIPRLKLMICYEELSEKELVDVLGSDPMKYLTRGWKNTDDDYRPWAVLRPRRKEDG